MRPAVAGLRPWDPNASGLIVVGRSSTLSRHATAGSSNGRISAQCDRQGRPNHGTRSVCAALQGVADLYRSSSFNNAANNASGSTGFATDAFMPPAPCGGVSGRSALPPRSPLSLLLGPRGGKSTSRRRVGGVASIPEVAQLVPIISPTPFPGLAVRPPAGSPLSPPSPSPALPPPPPPPSHPSPPNFAPPRDIPTPLPLSTSIPLLLSPPSPSSPPPPPISQPPPLTRAVLTSLHPLSPALNRTSPDASPPSTATLSLPSPAGESPNATSQKRWRTARRHRPVEPAHQTLSSSRTNLAPRTPAQSGRAPRPTPPTPATHPRGRDRAPTPRRLGHDSPPHLETVLPAPHAIPTRLAPPHNSPPPPPPPLPSSHPLPPHPNHPSPLNSPPPDLGPIVVGCHSFPNRRPTPKGTRCSRVARHCPV